MTAKKQKPTFTTTIEALEPFYKLNPSFDIHKVDLHDEEQLDTLKWKKLDKKETLERLRLYQRLLRIHNDEKIAQKLAKAGYHSAHHIASMSQERFVMQNKKISGNEELLREIHTKATDIKGRMALIWGNIKDWSASPHYRNAQFANVPEEMMSLFTKLPSYEQMFGLQNYCSCSECMSMLSPAAYFVDIMRLAQEYITALNPGIPEGRKLIERRPDLFLLPLSCENTNKMVPYLRIVNDVIKTRINKDDPEKVMRTLATARFPFNLPFNLPLEEIRGYLGHFNTSLAAVYEALALDAKIAAREALDLSIEELNIITTKADAAQLAIDFSWPVTGNDLAGLDKLKNFTAQTRLGDAKVRELVYLDLAQEEILNISGRYTANNAADKFTFTQTGNKVIVNYEWVSGSKGIAEGVIDGNIVTWDWKQDVNGAPVSFRMVLNFSSLGKTFEGWYSYENNHVAITGVRNTEDPVHRNVLGSFYINQVLTDTYAFIARDITDKDHTYYKIQDLGIVNLDRINRFIRLASYLQLSYTDLNWVLGSIGITGEKDITVETPGLLAKIITLQKKYELSTEEIAAWWSDMKTIGTGAPEHTRNLFDRTFNTPTVFYNPDNKKDQPPYHPLYSLNPLYNDTVLKWYPDPAVQASLNNDEKDENTQIRSRLMAALSVSDNDLTIIGKYVLDNNNIGGKYLELDVPTLTLLYRVSSMCAAFRLSVAEFIELCSITGQEPVKKTNTPAQFIEAAVQLSSMDSWMDASGINVYQLQYATTGNYNSAQVDPGYRESDVPAMLQGLWQSSQSWMAQENTFEYGNIDLRESNEIVVQLMAQGFITGSGIVLDTPVEYDTLDTLIRLNGRSFIIEGVIDEAVSKAVFDKLKEAQYGYINAENYLTDKYTEGTDLGFLFAEGTELRAAKIEEVKNTLLSIRFLSSLLAVQKDSFVVPGLIDAAASASVFSLLAEKGVITSNGILASFGPGIDLSFLFSGDANKETKISEVRQVLMTVRNNIVHVVDTLKNIREQQRQGVLAVLGTFLNADPGLLRVLLFDLVFKVLPAADYIELLLTKQADEKKLGKVYELMKLVARSLYVMRILDINAEQAANILAQPMAFGLKKIDESFTFHREAIQSLHAFREQVDKFGDTTNSLSAYYRDYYGKTLDDAKKNALIKITGWSKEQLSGLITARFSNLEIAEVKGVQTLDNVFTLASSIGVDTGMLLLLGKLGTLAVSDADWQIYLDTAKYLFDAVNARYSAEEWDSIYDPIRDAFNEKERDALVSYIIHLLRDQQQIYTTSDLYQYLLLDVQISGCADTTRISQGIGSVQLYIQRCFMHLEDDVERNGIKPLWWQWMSAYRVWEVNRKVFLYPESYIDPTLRKIRSGIYQEMLEELQQGDVTAESIQAAFMNYLNKFADLAGLTIIDSCYADTPGLLQGNVVARRTYYVFGRTNTAPYTWYYRTAVIDKVKESNQVSWWKIGNWTFWEKIDLPINSAYITPVFAFNRMHIFWAEQTALTGAVFTGGNSQDTIVYKGAIRYSFLDFNNTWVTGQTLASDIVMLYQPDTSYMQKVEDYITKMNLEFNMESPMWNKPYAIFLERINGPFEEDRIIAGFGDAPKTLPPQSHRPVSPSSEGNQQQIDFNNTLYKAIDNAVIAGDSIQAGNVLALPAFSLDSTGQSMELELLWENDRPSNPRPYRAVANPLGSQLTVAETRNVLFDNYMGDFMPGEINGVMIAGGEANFAEGKIVSYPNIDVFDSNSGKHSAAMLSVPRSKFAAVSIGNVLLFAGGRVLYQNGAVQTDTVDMYNFETGRWTAARLATAREQLHAVTAGPYAVFAGGKANNNAVNTIDLYNSITNEWTTLQVGFRSGQEIYSVAAGINGAGNEYIAILASLNELLYHSELYLVDLVTRQVTKGMHYLAFNSVVAWESYFLLTGGFKHVYAYNFATNKGDYYESFPTPRWGMGVTVANGKAYFAGGDGDHDKIEVYDFASNTWSSPWKLSQGRGYLTAAASATQIVFAGGLNKGVVSNVVDVFDIASGKHSERQIDPPRTNPASTGIAVNRNIDSAKSVMLLDKIPVSGDTVTMVKNQPGWFTCNTGSEEFLVIPQDGSVKTINDIVRGRQILLPGENSLEMYTNPFTEKYPDFTKLDYLFARLNTTSIRALSRKILAGGPDLLLSLDSQYEPETRFSSYAPNEERIKPLPPNEISFESPYAMGEYFREVFFWIPLMVADLLHNNQRFAEAKKWYEYIFNPMAEREDGQFYWRCRPLRDITPQSLESILTDPEQLMVYENDPFDPSTIAWLRRTALQKAVVMKYIKNLIDWGDNLFAQDTWESINEATMLYVMADDMLGPKPQSSGLCPVKNTRTFSDILAKYGDHIPDFLIQLENFYTPMFGTVPLAEKPWNEIDSYFCVAENPEFTANWDLVQDRLYKIRHCMNLQGVVRSLSPFAPPIDVNALLRAAATGGIPEGVSGQYPVPIYRFTFLLEKARNLTSAAIQLGSSLLSAIEKRDGEQLALLRSTQELALLRMQRTEKEQQLQDAQFNEQNTMQGLLSAENRKQFYNMLISAGLSAEEQGNMNDMAEANRYNIAAAALRAASSIGYAIPQFGAPTALTYGGQQVGSVISAAASAVEIGSIVNNFNAQMKLTRAGYNRRAQDWRLQLQIASYDVTQFNAQLEAAKVRVDIAKREIEIHDRSIEQSENIEAFLKTKFTNKELYQWMLGKLAVVYFQTYKLAFDTSLAAEKAYHFERDTEDKYISYGYWDSLHKGLMAGELLNLSLNQMEKAYLATNVRELEIEKTISLFRTDPLALLKLRTEGKCSFDLTEKLYDADFPGHYRRKIKTVSITIPAVVGPYQNINATLLQTGNKVILKPDLNAVNFLAGGANAKEPDASALRSNWRTYQQIALSGGVNDNGMFELNYRDDRYLPFEGTGAVSSWELSIPKSNNSFDLSSITDVIVKVSYTAVPGGAAFADAVRSLPEIKRCAGYRALVMRQDFALNWNAFMSPAPNATQQLMQLQVTKSMFPSNIDLDNNFKITGLWLALDLADGIVTEKAFKINVKANGVDFSKTALEIPAGISMGSAVNDNNVKEFFKGWTLSIEKSDIPEALQGANKFLDPSKVRNMAFVLVFEGEVI